MGVALEELNAAVAARASADRVLELVRKQHWCVPEARLLAGRALSAGALLKAWDARVAEVASTGAADELATAAKRRDAAKRVFDKAVSDAVSLEAEVRRPAVATWHSRRRAAILQAHPEVAKLYGETWASPGACLALCALQAFVALRCLAPRDAEKPFDAYYLLRAAAWALTVGANAAFGAQALNHELSHAKTRWLAAPCALVASAMTTFPWFSYYFAGGHERHHLHVGTPRDADADALFWLWERQPVHRADVWGAGPKEPRPLTTLQRLGDSAAGGVAWASTVAAALPVAYAYSLLSCLKDDWNANKKETSFWLLESSASFLVFRALTRCCDGRAHAIAAVAYLAISAAASVGFLCHPCIGFWLMQHACATDADGDSRMAPAYSGPLVGPASTPKLDRLQPTLSYCGSDLWHWLTFQELRHLEHHDFPRIPWVRLPELARLAPEFYSADHVYHVPSIARLCGAWLGATREKFDFACRRRLVANARGRAVAQPLRYAAPPLGGEGDGMVYMKGG